MRRLLNQSIPYLLITPALLLVVGVSLYPTLYSFYLSLHRNRRGALEYVGLRNFDVLFDSPNFWWSLRLTVVFGVIFVLCVMIIALLLALIFNYRRQLTGIYMIIIVIPWVLSEIVTGVMFRWMFLPSVGILQNAFSTIVGDVALLSTGIGAMAVIISATVWRSVAFAFLLLLAGLQVIPPEFREAAAIDGANQWQRFWKITWPLSLPTIQITLVLLSIQAVNTVGLFLTITNGGPGRSTEVLSLQTYREAIEFFNFGYGSALAVIMFVINGLLALAYLHGIRSRTELSGVV